MTAGINQAITPRNITRLEKSTRRLTIERTGDFWRGKITPRIRIAGRWLDRAGFKPGNRVEVRIDGPGALTLRFLAQEGASESQSL